MSCSPSYGYRPTVRPSPTQSGMPAFAEHRSRLFAGGTYFRSLGQSQSQNDISLEVTVGVADATLNVRVQGSLQESYTVPQVLVLGVCTGGITAMRAAVNGGSSLIEMYARGLDIFDGGADDPSNCLTAFPDTNMTGGSGAPQDATQAFLDTIFTGLERTMIVVSDTEDINGNPITPPTSRRVQQWDGTQWIQYSNLVQGACPVDGPPV